MALTLELLSKIASSWKGVKKLLLEFRKRLVGELLTEMSVVSWKIEHVLEFVDLAKEGGFLPL